MSVNYREVYIWQRTRYLLIVYLSKCNKARFHHYKIYCDIIWTIYESVTIKWKVEAELSSKAKADKEKREKRKKEKENAQKKDEDQGNEWTIFKAN